MNTVDIEKLNQLMSRTDISGNDKVKWLTEFIDGRELQVEQEQKLYTEQEVIDLLETQRGNCYVAILTETKNDEIATISLTAPEPGGRNGSWKK
jgi:hypothetical protein